MADTYEVRDLREGFLWINNEVFDVYAPRIGASAFLVYVALARFASNSTGRTFPDQQLIADKLELSVRTVIRSIKVLADAGLLRVVREKAPKGKFAHNVYTLLRPSDNLSCGTSAKPSDKPSDTGVTQTIKNQKEQSKTSEVFDLSRAVKLIRERHPRSEGRIADIRAIKAAVARLRKERDGITEHEACTLLFVAAARYSMERQNQDPQFTKTCSAWFNGAYYEKYEQKPVVSVTGSGPDGLAEIRARRSANAATQ